MDIERAADQWGLNCGPAALCTMLSLPPDRVRTAIPDFEKKGYTSPTMMKQALCFLNVTFCTEPSVRMKLEVIKDLRTDPDRQIVDADLLEVPRIAVPQVVRDRELFPIYGLARIQFEGPWENPGVPPQAAYKYTHWVGSMVFPVIPNHEKTLFIFDVNFGWQPFDNWQSMLPALIEQYKRTTGGWHVTHRWQLFV